MEYEKYGEVFRHEGVTLINGDCMELLADLDDNAFELAVVDPPYGIGMSGGGVGKGEKHTRKDWDACIPDQSYFSKLSKVSNNQIIWGANYMCHFLPMTGAWLYWDKMQDGFGKSFSTGELAWTSFGKTMKQVRYKWQGNYCGFEGAITTKSSNGMQNIHPTQKPVKLYEWVYSNYAKPDDRILDTHLGSGSSAIAAHRAGLEFVGIELDPDYFAAAVGRFKRETAQQSLF